MYQFTFKCCACHTKCDGYECLGRDDELNLIVGWWCEVCEKQIVAKAPIEYLFNIRIIKPEDEVVPTTGITEEDMDFLSQMKVSYDDKEERWNGNGAT